MANRFSISNLNSDSSPTWAYPKRGLDTIATRFLMLFSIFLMIPLIWIILISLQRVEEAHSQGITDKLSLLEKQIPLMQGKELTSSGYLIETASGIVLKDLAREGNSPVFLNHEETAIASHHQWQVVQWNQSLWASRSIVVPEAPNRQIVVMTSINSALDSFDNYRWQLYWASVIGVLLSVILAMVFSRNITQPILKLIEQLEAFTQKRDRSSVEVRSGVYEIQTLATAFNRLFSKLKEEEQRRNEFVATLTHDLKVPIIAEKQSLMFLSQGTYGPLSTTQMTVVDALRSANQTVLTLVNSMLDVSRYESQNVQLTIRKQDMAALLDVTVKELSGLLEEKRLDVQFEFNIPEPNGASCYGDAIELKRLLQNLLGNAIVNTPDGGQIKLVLANQDGYAVDFLQRVSTYTDSSLADPVAFQGYLLFSIENTGSGFLKQDLPHLFQRFAFNQGRNPMGTGLGLYNCYQIVQAHRGKIWVESSEGEGAAVNVLLPLQESVFGERRQGKGRREGESEGGPDT
jgi:signal transduction histidine kinase